jgi:hypothetical protein
MCAENLPAMNPIQYQSNPLAQAWRLPSFEQPFASFRYVKAATFTIDAGAYVPRNLVELDGDADMCITEVSFGRGAAAAGTILARITTGDGLRMSYDLLATEEIEGALFPELGMKARSRLLVDLQNNGGSDVDVQVQFKGWKQSQRISPGACVPGFGPETYNPAWASYSKAPAGWKDLPFQYYFELSALALQDQDGIPLNIEDDAVFFARGISGVSDGDGAQKFILTDPYGTQLSSDFVTQDCFWGQGGLQKPLYPEIFCPPGSSFQLRAQEYLNATTTARFVLHGVKRVPDVSY